MTAIQYFTDIYPRSSWYEQTNKQTGIDDSISPIQLHPSLQLSAPAEMTYISSASLPPLPNPAESFHAARFRSDVGAASESGQLPTPRARCFGAELLIGRWWLASQPPEQYLAYNVY